MSMEVYNGQFGWGSSSSFGGSRGDTGGLEGGLASGFNAKIKTALDSSSAQYSNSTSLTTPDGNAATAGQAGTYKNISGSFYSTLDKGGLNLSSSASAQNGAFVSDPMFSVISNGKANSGTARYADGDYTGSVSAPTDGGGNTQGPDISAYPQPNGGFEHGGIRPPISGSDNYPNPGSKDLKEEPTIININPNEPTSVPVDPSTHPIFIGTAAPVDIKTGSDATPPPPVDPIDTPGGYGYNIKTPWPVGGGIKRTIKDVGDLTPTPINPNAGTTRPVDPFETAGIKNIPGTTKPLTSQTGNVDQTNPEPQIPLTRAEEIRRQRAERYNQQASQAGNTPAPQAGGAHTSYSTNNVGNVINPLA